MESRIEDDRNLCPVSRVICFNTKCGDVCVKKQLEDTIILMPDPTKVSWVHNVVLSDAKEIDLLQDERLLMKKTVDLWNTFVTLPPMHSMEQADFCDAIHRIQDLIGTRIAMKTAPDIYGTRI
jgi:hypothetical protein